MLNVARYFGTEASVSAVTVPSTSQSSADAAAIQQADQDLVSPSPSYQGIEAWPAVSSDPWVRTASFRGAGARRI